MGKTILNAAFGATVREAVSLEGHLGKKGRYIVHEKMKSTEVLRKVSAVSSS